MMKLNITDTNEFIYKADAVSQRTNMISRREGWGKGIVRDMYTLLCLK